MRKPLALAAAAVGTAALAVPAFAATKSVKVADNYFVKDKAKISVTVNKNDTVKWNFAGKFPHNVTVRSGPVKFKSTTKTSGSYAKKVTKAGTYKIICTVHGATDQSMTLKVME